MQTIKIELSTNEAQALVDLLDLATKAGGLGAAKHSVPLTDKVMRAVQASREQSTETADASG